MINFKKIKYIVTNKETGITYDNVIEIVDQTLLNMVNSKYLNQEAIIWSLIIDDLKKTVDESVIREIYYFQKEYNISWQFVDESIDETTLESEVSHILDSGNRTKYKTGAVRDVREGKGRCDLIPPSYMAAIIDDVSYVCDILRFIYEFQRTGKLTCLRRAVRTFLDTRTIYDDIFTGFLELSKHYEEGAKKYGEYNWQKGIPLHCYIDSGIRHLLKFARGDKDEPHDRAFVWNMIGAMWTYDNMPELNDYTRNDQSDS